MIQLLVPLPKKLYVACSGGVDSMAALDFLNRKHDVTAAFFDHGTSGSATALNFLARYLKSRNIKMELGVINKDKPKEKSLEEHWRDERYAFLEALDAPVVTAHHLDDAVETWVWSSMHGKPTLPHVMRKNIVRPFLSTPKVELMNWCLKNNVLWHDDLSNLDTKYMRNFIRHQAMPVIQQINPGIHKVIKKKLTQSLEPIL